MDKLGKLLVKRSQKEAATILLKMRSHAKDIKENDLPPDKIDELSNEFFGMNEEYKSFLGCSSHTGHSIGNGFWIAGPAIAVSGLALTFTGDTYLGPIMVVTGATAFKAGESLKEKAEAYEDQLELYETVKELNQKRDSLTKMEKPRKLSKKRKNKERQLKEACNS